MVAPVTLAYDEWNTNNNNNNHCFKPPGNPSHTKEKKQPMSWNHYTEVQCETLTLDQYRRSLVQAYKANQKLDGFDKQRMQEKPHIALLKNSYWEQRVDSIE